MNKNVNFKVLKTNYDSPFHDMFVGKVYSGNLNGEVLTFVDNAGGKQLMCVNHRWKDYIELLQKEDDPLPEVPREVRYDDDTYPGQDFLEIQYQAYSGIRLKAFQTLEDEEVTTYLRLSPETALDLAADLTRMALKLKREEEETND